MSEPEHWTDWTVYIAGLCGAILCFLLLAQSCKVETTPVTNPVLLRGNR